MPRVITTAIIKGGAGKSTTTAALAQAGADEGRRVLVIDMDPQGNLTAFVGAEQSEAGVFAMLHDAVPNIQHTEQGVDVIAASPDLATERTTPGSAMRLAAALEPIKEGYDLILIDTPPHMGELAFNALQAADGLLVPMEADNSSVQGLYQVADIAGQIRRNSNPGLRVLGTVITRYDPRPKINRFFLDAIRERGQEVGAPLLMAIRVGVAVREAQAMGESLYQYAPRSKPAQDYKKLFNMIMEE